MQTMIGAGTREALSAQVMCAAGKAVNGTMHTISDAIAFERHAFLQMGLRHARIHQRQLAVSRSLSPAISRQ